LEDILDFNKNLQNQIDLSKNFTESNSQRVTNLEKSIIQLDKEVATNLKVLSKDVGDIFSNQKDLDWRLQ